MVIEVLQTLLGMILVVAVHEMGHAGAILLTRAGEIKRFHISWKGVGIEWEPSDNVLYKRIVVSLGGFIANCLMGLLWFAGGLVYLAFMSLLFGFLNLLPLIGSDGYRVYKMIREGVESE